MKTKLFIYSATLAIAGTAATMLLIESCTKNDRSATKTLNSASAVLVNGASAVEDTIATNWFKRNSNSLGSIAFDQAASVPLSSGKVLWFTGDTYYDDLNSDGTTPCLFNYHNTVLQQPSTSNWTQSSTTNLLYATSPQIFTALNSGTSKYYYWPIDGVEIGSSVYTYLVEMDSTAYIGGQVGVFNESNNTVNYSTVTLPNLAGISYQNGMFKVGTTVYVYGTKLTDGYGDSQVYVAKFSISSPATWSFWNGSTWASAPTAGSGVVATTTSNSLCVSYVNGKYVMVITQFNYQCNEGTAIYGSTSTSPTSGFSTPITIYNIPDTVDGDTPHFYTPEIHPEFNANSRFMFTYCLNTYAPCIAQCNSGKATPDYYRPRAVWVPYSVLGL
jgi:hypothetical protein